MNRPRVLVLASQKGGVGKTALTAHLGVAADLAGFGPVVLYDTDPQPSLTEWWKDREAPEPRFAKGGIADLPLVLDRLGDAGVRLVVIDTPPANTDSIRAVLAHADFVLVPCQDGKTDMRAVTKTVAMVRELKKPFAFALTFVNRRTGQTADATRLLSHYGPLAALVSYRVIFKKSANDGRTAQELEPNGPAAQEIAELWGYVGTQMGFIEPARAEKEFV